MIHPFHHRSQIINNGLKCKQREAKKEEDQPNITILRMYNAETYDDDMISPRISIVNNLECKGRVDEEENSNCVFLTVIESR